MRLSFSFFPLLKKLGSSGLNKSFSFGRCNISNRYAKVFNLLRCNNYIGSRKLKEHSGPFSLNHLETGVVLSSQFLGAMKKKYFYINLAFDGTSSYGIVETITGPTLIGLIKEQFSEFNVHIFPSSRLDRGVSAKDLWLLLIVEKDEFEIDTITLKLKDISIIQLLNIIETNSESRVLNLVDSKIYHYYFQFGGNSQSKFITNFKENLDIDSMKNAAKLFEGCHNFKSFSIRTNKNANYTRNVIHSEIIRGYFNLFPICSLELKDVFCFKVQANGFLRGQVRMMVGALIKIGKKEINIRQLEQALQGDFKEKIGFKVPSQSLILEKSILKSSTRHNS